MPHTPWDNDKIQFARLIAELFAGVGFTADDLLPVCDSMDLAPADLDAIVTRAQAYWEARKAPEGRTLERPLTLAEARARADANGYVAGVVVVELVDAIRRDLDAWLDFLGTRLVEGGEILEELSGTVVGHQGNELLVEVTGCLRGLAACDEAHEAAGEE